MENTRELDFEDLDKVTGGTKAEAKAYLNYLIKKYGTSLSNELKKLCTQEEKEYYYRAYNHKKGDEPLGPYPD